MSDEDAERARATEPTVQLDPDEVQRQLEDGPRLGDPEDFVETQEMDSMSRVGLDTDPSQPSLETTQRYDVPDDLLQMAMRSQEMEVVEHEDEPADHEWREFVAIVDPRGRIVLPSRVQRDLRGKKLRVKYVVDE